MDATYQYGHRNPAFNGSFDFSNQMYYQNQDSPHHARDDLMLRRQRKTRKRVCLVIIAVVVILILVAITIGVYMVVSGNKDDQKYEKMEFQASITVNINWISAYDNTGSDEYKAISSRLKQEVEDGLSSSSMSSQFSHVDITGIRQGSVIFDMTIYMTSRKGTRELSTSTVMDTLQTVVKKSKNSSPGSLLAGVHSISIKDTSSSAQLVVQLTTTTTTTVQPTITHVSIPLTSTTTTHIPTTVPTTRQTTTRTTTSYIPTTAATTRKEVTTTSTTAKTTTSSTTPIITTTTSTSKATQTTTSSMTTTTFVTTTIATTSTDGGLGDNDGPCRNETYLESILLSNCLDFVELGQAASKSETEKCKFITNAVDCVVKKVLDDTGAVCTDEHKANVLAKYNNILQLYLGIDGNICFNFG